MYESIHSVILEYTREDRVATKVQWDRIVSLEAQFLSRREHISMFT